MKTHTTNYQDTLIEVAADCPATAGEVPPGKAGARTIAGMQFDLIARHPYRYTSDDVLFLVFAERNGIPAGEHAQAREKLFSKGQACLRSSPLAKRYGWGIHADAQSRVALYGMETAAYRELAGNPAVRKVKAMRASRNPA